MNTPRSVNYIHILALKSVGPNDSNTNDMVFHAKEMNLYTAFSVEER